MNKLHDLTCEYEIKSEDDKVATFTGVASTNDVDSDGDIIEAGAFDPIPTKTAPNGETIPNVLMLRDHDRSQIIGGWKAFKQKGGELHVTGELALEVPKARETHALMKRGYLSGLSVCFAVKDASHVMFNQTTGRRHIKKALLRETSIVGFPANNGARIISVKAEIDQWLFENGLDESDLLQLMKDAQKPYGDVTYADPGYQDDGKKRYPIDSERHIRAAWSYIHQRSNQRPYTAEQVAAIKRRIVAAWKRVIDKDGPPAHQDDKSELDDDLLILGIDGHDRIDESAAAKQLRDLLAKVKERVS